MYHHQVACLLVVCACGGAVVGQDAGDAGFDAPASDAGWTSCSTPEGYDLCGGQTQCNKGCQCSDPTGFGSCISSPSPYSGLVCTPGLDGDVCTAAHNADGSTFWVDTAYDFGVLLAQSGDSNDVRYADLSLWTGDLIPMPSTCPTIGASVCGGACGKCPASETCVGRSPLHPVGVCDPQQTAPCGPDTAFDFPCPAPDGCFVFKVQPSAQADANVRGVCLPLAACQALAQSLPGGGVCTPGN